MPFSFGSERPQVSQQLISFPLTVPGAGLAIPISQSLDKSRLITTFSVSNPVAGSSVYLGNAGVTATGTTQGFEIPPGTAPAFRTFQETRQLYELQGLIVIIARVLNCTLPEIEKIPFIVWDLTQLYLFSANAGGSQVTIAAFPQAYL
jgi:hypothetical protein